MSRIRLPSLSKTANIPNPFRQTSSPKPEYAGPVLIWRRFRQSSGPIVKTQSCCSSSCEVLHVRTCYPLHRIFKLAEAYPGQKECSQTGQKDCNSKLKEKVSPQSSSSSNVTIPYLREALPQSCFCSKLVVCDARCVCTVLSLMKSCVAISFPESPRAAGEVPPFPY